jgi:hypothetical protein
MAAVEADFERAVAALYRLPVAEFVDARDQLARQLRTAGDQEAARADTVARDAEQTADEASRSLEALRQRLHAAKDAVNAATEAHAAAQAVLEELNE